MSINENIISFFVKYSILGKKSQDFLDFCKVTNLILNKFHLTKEGLNKIRLITNGMNAKRK